LLAVAPLEGKKKKAPLDCPSDLAGRSAARGKKNQLITTPEPTLFFSQRIASHWQQITHIGLHLKKGKRSI
jgi:hypothetical protein